MENLLLHTDKANFIWLLIVVYLLSAVDRLREITTFTSWFKLFAAKFRLQPGSFWYKWWQSKDDDELKFWLLYPIRDGYHACKSVFFSIMILALLLFAMSPTMITYKICASALIWWAGQKSTFYLLT